MGFVTSDGCNLYYEEVGEGPPILLIHPAGGVTGDGDHRLDAVRVGR